jgi:hypothetical protein
MNAADIVWPALSGFLLIVSAALFLITGASRRHLDSALKQAAAPASENPDALPQLGFYESWSRKSSKALAVPERRWTYDQDYMIAFIGALLPAPDATEADDGGTTRRSALEIYADRILPLDIGFAVAFAVFIACTALLIADSLSEWPWIARACVIFASLGLVYGAADTAEDLKLRSILAHAKRVSAAKEISESRVSGTALADAAEVDAANALTRMKVASLAASTIGLVAFGLLLVLDAAVVRISRGPGAGASAAPQHTVTEQDIGPATA